MAKNKVYKGFYNCERLVSSKDANGETPGAFIVCSKERGPGKTFSFSKLFIDNYFSDGEKLKNKLGCTGHKFILLTRRKGDIGNIADGVLKSFVDTEYPDYVVEEVVRLKNCYSDINLVKSDGNGGKIIENIGYVIALAAAVQVKTISSMFTDACAMWMDEFQVYGGEEYLKDEIGKLKLIHDSCARGHGKSERYLPIFLSSNTIQFANPYFIAFGLVRYIQSNTKFYKGNGVVFERCEVEGLKELHETSAFAKALSGYNTGSDNTYLLDEDSCVGKPTSDWGRCVYMCTLIENGQKYAVKEYPSIGYTYIDYKVDNTCPYVYNMTVDGNLNIPMLRNTNIFKMIKKRFQNGQLRMYNNLIKGVVLDMFV